MTNTPGLLPKSCRDELARAMLIPDRQKRLAAIDKARERAAYTHPQLFKENTHMSVKLKDVRLAFPNLFVPKAFEAGGKADFNGAFLLPKDHPQIAEIKQAMKEAAKEKWGAKAQDTYALLEKQGKLAMRDGDTKPDLDGYEGHMFINARNKTKPTVVDKDKSELSESSGKPYAGCFVNVILEFWAQDNQYGKRINASLGGVQFLRDGDAFSGGRPASADDFDDLDAGGAGSSAADDPW